MRYKDLERINQSNECCYHKVRIQKYDDGLNNYLLSDDNADVMCCNIKGIQQNSKYHMLVLTLEELLNLIVYRDEYVYITNLEILKCEEGLADYNIQRQLQFSFVNKSDYYINDAKDVDESFFKYKLYMRVLQNASEVVVDRKIKVADICDVLYGSENEGYNVITDIVERVNEKLEKHIYSRLTEVEEHMLKNILRSELADRLML